MDSTCMYDECARSVPLCMRLSKPSLPAPPPPQAWSGFTAWLVHLLVAKFLLKAMNLPSSVTWVELFAYTGYAYVPVCLAIAAGQALGRMAYYGMWLYGSLASAIFLVRTMKRIIFQEARDYSEPGVTGGGGG